MKPRSELALLLPFVFLLGMQQVGFAQNDSTSYWLEQARKHSLARPAKAWPWAQQLIKQGQLPVQLQAEAWLHASRYHSYEADYGLEMQALNRALQLLSHTQNDSLKGILWEALGHSHFQQGGQEASKQALDSARTYFTKANHQDGLSDVERRVGNLLWANQQQAEAAAIFRKALYLSTTPRSRALALNNLGVSLLEMGKIQDAYDTLLLSRDAYRNYDSLYRMASVYGNLAHASLEMGWLKMARQFADSSLHFALVTEHRYAQYEAWTLIASIEESAGNFEMALFALKKWRELVKSIHTSEKQQSVAQAKIEVATKALELEQMLMAEKLAKAKAERNNWVLISIIGILSLVALWRHRYQKQLSKIKLEKLEKAALASELKLKEAEAKGLQQQIEANTRSLLAHSLQLAQKNELMQSVSSELRELAAQMPSNHRKTLMQSTKKLSNQQYIEKDWEVFRAYFEQIHPSFFEKLQQLFPSLTASDIRLCALIKLKMDNKTIAGMLGVNPESVKMARYRLRKKIQVEEQSLAAFLQSM